MKKHSHECTQSYRLPRPYLRGRAKPLARGGAPRRVSAAGPRAVVQSHIALVVGNAIDIRVHAGAGVTGTVLLAIGCPPTLSMATLERQCGSLDPRILGLEVI